MRTFQWIAVIGAVLAAGCAAKDDAVLKTEEAPPAKSDKPFVGEDPNTMSLAGFWTQTNPQTSTRLDFHLQEGGNYVLDIAKSDGEKRTETGKWSEIDHGVEISLPNGNAPTRFMLEGRNLVAPGADAALFGPNGGKLERRAN